MSAYSRSLGISILLLLSSNLFAQQDSTEQENAIKFGIGILLGITVNDHSRESPRNDPKGLDLMLEGFFERKVLQNTTISLGLSLSYFKGEVSNGSISSIPFQDSVIVTGSKIGDVSISSLRLKIPLRLRLYYLTQEKFRIFAEPGIFVITELKSSRNYTFQKNNLLRPLFSNVPQSSPSRIFRGTDRSQ